MRTEEQDDGCLPCSVDSSVVDVRVGYKKHIIREMKQTSRSRDGSPRLYKMRLIEHKAQEVTFRPPG
jgi:hypothetical protein